MNTGIQYFHYSRELPVNSIAIAQVSTPPATPDQLTDINNTIYNPGTLTAQGSPSGTTFTAADYNQQVAISGYTTYKVQNQFFELTDQTDGSGNGLFYQHSLPPGITNITILDLNGDEISTGYVVRSLTRNVTPITYILHSFPKVTYQVRYIDAAGFLHLDLLNYDNVISYNQLTTSVNTYTTVSSTFTVNSVTTYYIRWYTENGYQLLDPYGTTSNDPWHVRIRYNLLPTPPEWANQNWNPSLPYMLATWVPGVVLSNNIIQFERKPIYFQNGTYPDVLVYDSNYNLKYALAGRPNNGFLFPWKLNQFTDIDVNTATIQLAVTVDPTDIVFGFYSYTELDVIFTALDINPYTNPSIKNKSISFCVKTNGIDPLHYLYYTIYNADGSVFSTNDQSPATGAPHHFGTLIVNSNINIGNYVITDVRQRGGGLAPQYQNIPQSVNMWDLGFWDGKPYPIGGVFIVYLSDKVLNTFQSSQVVQIVQNICPMGVLPIVRFFDSLGNETIPNV